MDIGGGYGEQAIRLAEAGHSVCIVDIDANMLEIARERLTRCSPQIRGRIELVLGDGASATELVGRDFDLACCHNVLMYEDDAALILHELVRLVRVGGLLSVLSLNTAAYAMRSGLQQRWDEAAAILQGGELPARGPVRSRPHSREKIVQILQDAGATPKEWQGIGVFTDHVTTPIVVDDPAEVERVEWLAGHRDPYRQVARCFHLLAVRARRSSRRNR